VKAEKLGAAGGNAAGGAEKEGVVASDVGGRRKDERLAPKSAGRVVAGSAAGRDEKALTEGSGSAVVERGRELNEGGKDELKEGKEVVAADAGRERGRAGAVESVPKEVTQGADRGREGAKLVHVVVGNEGSDNGIEKVVGNMEGVDSDPKHGGNGVLRGVQKPVLIGAAKEGVQNPEVENPVERKAIFSFPRKGEIDQRENKTKKKKNARAANSD